MTNPMNSDKTNAATAAQTANPSAARRGFPLGCKIGCGLLCAVSVAFVCFCVWFAVSFATGLKNADQHTQGEFANLSELDKDPVVAQRLKPVIDDMIPPEATEIKFKGDAGFLASGAGFSCKVSEADFLRFASEHEYPLATNVFRNANVEIVDNHSCPAEMDMNQIEGALFTCGPDGTRLIDDEAIPKRYISYWFGYRNHGGIILAFDLDTQILYGSYSSN